MSWEHETRNSESEIFDRLSRASSCVPNGRFWNTFLNNLAFPNLKSIGIHHYWATIPSQGANLSIQAENCKYQSSLGTSSSFKSSRGTHLGFISTIRIMTKCVTMTQ